MDEPFHYHRNIGTGRVIPSLSLSTDFMNWQNNRLSGASGVGGGTGGFDANNYDSGNYPDVLLNAAAASQQSSQNSFRSQEAYMEALLLLQRQQTIERQQKEQEQQQQLELQQQLLLQQKQEKEQNELLFLQKYLQYQQGGAPSTSSTLDLLLSNRSGTAGLQLPSALSHSSSSFLGGSMNSNSNPGMLDTASYLLLQQMQQKLQTQPSSSSPLLTSNHLMKNELLSQVGNNSASSTSPWSLNSANMQSLREGRLSGVAQSSSGSFITNEFNASSGSIRMDPYTGYDLFRPWSDTSAGLLEKINEAATSSQAMSGMKGVIMGREKKRKVSKKPKDRPKRPLSAYNLFFQEERTRILNQIPDATPSKKRMEPDEDDATVVKEEEKGTNKQDEENSEEDMNTAGAQLSNKKKRPHGKIGFETLAKTIGKRWKALDGDTLAYFQTKADEDMKRYKEEMQQYLTKQRSSKLSNQKKPSEAEVTSDVEDAQEVAQGIEEDEEARKSPSDDSSDENSVDGVA